MASWIGLKILIQKHPWKSKIGLLQTILAAKRYVSFFLGHPVFTGLLQPTFKEGTGSFVSGGPYGPEGEPLSPHPKSILGKTLFFI